MPGAFAKHAVQAQPDEQCDEGEDDDDGQTWVHASTDLPVNIVCER